MSCLYDLGMGPLERSLLGPVRARLLAPLAGDILELGAGTGVNFRHYGPHCRVLAVEPDERMRARARTRLRPNLELRDGAAERIELPDASFDHVVCTLVLCSLERPGTGLREIARLLRPGGVLHLLEHVRGQGRTGAWHDWLNPGWNNLSGGCNLNRRTLVRAQAMGFQVTWQEALPGHLPIPFVAARLKGPTRLPPGC